MLFLHILKYKMLAYLKGSFDLRVVSLAKGFGSMIVFGMFAFGAFLLSRLITTYVLDQVRIGLFLYHRFISMVLFVLFVSVNLGNIIVAYSTLYRSNEVFFFFTKPVPHLSVFLLKFLDNFLYSSGTLFFISFAALVGYGTYFGQPWYIFLFVFFCMLVPFMFLSACLAALILMSLMKLAGRWGFRQVMTAIGSVYIGAVYLFFKLSSPIALIEEVGKYYPNVDQYLAQVDPGFLKFLPNNWVADALFFLAKGEFGRSLLFVGILIAVTIAAFILLVVIGKSFYYKSWLIALKSQHSRNTSEAGKKLKFFDFRKESLFPPQTEVLLKKDYFSFFRDPSQYVHFFVMLLLVVVFNASLRSFRYRAAMEMQMVTYIVLYLFGGFMVNAMALRFVFPMIGIEGMPFWIVLSAPIKRAKIYILKFVVSLIVLLILSETIAIYTNRPFVKLAELRPLLMYFGIFSAFWIALSVVSLNLGMGAFFANFQENNPIRIASTQGATLTFLASLVYLVVCFSLVAAPLFKYFEMIYLFILFDMRTIIVPGTIFGMVSAAIAGVGMVLGFRALNRDF
jgi:hypothetical protein